MLGFKIIEPGLFSTFQDQGRLGFQNQGLPISGAMDQAAMKIANELVDKKTGSVLEMTYMGAKIEFLKSMAIGITGADMQPSINNQAVENNVTVFVKAGDILSFKGLKSGFRTYIGFSDELILDEVFSSKSTYVKGGLGGYKGRALKKDDLIEVIEKICENKYRYLPQHDSDEIRVILSYEYASFKNENILFENEYTVRQEMDRMGMRLNGAPLIHKDTPDIISSPIIPGAIQIPKDGQPMIMLRDAQTVGGYTRIGCVLSCDLNKLAQKKPGDKIKFTCISYDEGVRIKKAQLSNASTVTLDEQVRVFDIKVNGKAFKVLVEEK